MEKYDVFVFGTGSAGQYVAKNLAKKGMKTAIIDRREYGGVCSLRGCDPKKLMLAPIQAWQQVQDFKDKGVKGHLELDWKKVVQRAEDYRKNKPQNTKEDLESLGITCLQGEAHFFDPHIIDLNGKHIRADYFVIATGMKTVSLDIPGEEHMKLYEHFFELREVPKEVVFAGGGYISMEFGHMLLRAGAQVTIIEEDSHILSPFEEYVADKVEEASKKAGLVIVTEAKVAEVTPDGKQYTVTYKKGDSTYELNCDLIFNCTGRIPSIDKLQLDKASVAVGTEGIKVNDRLQSISQEHIYACGDVSAKHVPLTPLSTREAAVVVKNISGDKEATIDYNIIPSAAFTLPQAASVGMTEKEAKKAHHDYKVIEKEASDFYNAKRVAADSYAFKLLINKKDDRILGAHIVGPEASEQINLFALAMCHGINMEQLENTIFTYPTWSNDLLSIRD